MYLNLKDVYAIWQTIDSWVESLIGCSSQRRIKVNNQNREKMVKNKVTFQTCVIRHAITFL